MLNVQLSKLLQFLQRKPTKTNHIEPEFVLKITKNNLMYNVLKAFALRFLKCLTVLRRYSLND